MFALKRNKLILFIMIRMVVSGIQHLDRLNVWLFVPPTAKGCYYWLTENRRRLRCSTHFTLKQLHRLNKQVLKSIVSAPLCRCRHTRTHHRSVRRNYKKRAARRFLITLMRSFNKQANYTSLCVMKIIQFN